MSFTLPTPPKNYREKYSGYMYLTKPALTMMTVCQMVVLVGLTSSTDVTQAKSTRSLISFEVLGGFSVM